MNEPVARRAVRARAAPQPATPARAVTAKPEAQAAAPSRPSSALGAQVREYQLDRMQRLVMFLDTMRECADNMLAHQRAGMPPLLAFEHELVLDARTFAKPANYALLRIQPGEDPCIQACARADARPVIVFDPRAGHGPGIGGFKLDSEVGIALHEGHVVYFVMFFPEPCPGQTLADVHHALRRFVAEVAERHPGLPPVLYGNCQAGWAVTLLSADCVGMTGPAVLNGSPLSYWAGEAGVNPMRLAAGFTGGTWAARLLADLGGGCFDGAWLVLNFENLNPGHAIFDKYYQLFANIDSERERFVAFERWWSGFYLLSREEIGAIVEGLFVGNRLEQGLMHICACCDADLRRIRNPLLVFASEGDNITPPHQALGWLPAVYPSTQALEEAGQRIVYLLNPHVGHLGIFVSASVARREHRAILEHVDALEALAPGLYEMIIEGETGAQACDQEQFAVRFEPRRVEDLRQAYPAHAYENVRRLSERLDALYGQSLGWWVRTLATPASGACLRWMHPMRASRYLFAREFNPWAPVWDWWSAWARVTRQAATPDNAFAQLERTGAQALSHTLSRWRDARDGVLEAWFAACYAE